MLILPVIDLLAGQVVRGVAGRRSEYRPIQSPLVADARPATVARAFRDRFGFTQVYVADLDAIAGRPANYLAWQEIAAEGFAQWLDAGVGSAELAREVSAALAIGSGFHKVLVGLETLASIAKLQRIVDAIDPQQVVFSLDLKSGKLLTSAPEFKSLTAVALADHVAKCGIQQMIVLDLANVGVNQGVGTLELCRQIHARHPNLQLIAGGGVRNLADLEQLANTGCCAALVASALHDGRLTAADCHAAERL